MKADKDKVKKREEDNTGKGWYKVFFSENLEKGS